MQNLDNIQALWAQEMPQLDTSTMALIGRLQIAHKHMTLAMSKTFRRYGLSEAGFDVLDHFTSSEQAWHDYYQPLKARVAEVKASMPNSNAIADIEREIAIYEGYLGEFGYHMFVLRKGA